MRSEAEMDPMLQTALRASMDSLADDVARVRNPEEEQRKLEGPWVAR